MTSVVFFLFITLGHNVGASRLQLSQRSFKQFFPRDSWLKDPDSNTPHQAGTSSGSDWFPVNYTGYQVNGNNAYGFLKIHKAASTTVQGIFLRYGWKKNLMFVLPPEYNAFVYPNIISINESITQYNTLPPPSGRTFGILCHHVVYNQEAWASVLPPHAVMIGTIREPFAHFVSTVDYFNPLALSKIAGTSHDPVKTYLQNPLQYEGMGPAYSFLNNRQAFEYGVHPDVIMNKDVDAFIDYITTVLSRQFKVVLIAERLDESLVLLKRRLNWTLSDIMYANKNIRMPGKPHRYQVTEDLRELHKKYAVFDYILYEFFYKKLEEEIRSEGPLFLTEVKHFTNTRAKAERFCHQFSKPKSMVIAKTQFNEEFSISETDCKLMHLYEIPFTQMIRKAQYGSATWSG